MFQMANLSTSLLSIMDMNKYNLSPNFTIDDLIKVAVDYKVSDHWFETETELVLVVFFCFVILCGLSGNIVVCLIICRNGNLKSTRNWYILNLSICEIMTCIMCMPFILVRMTLKNWRLGLVLCKLVPTLQTTYVAVSTLTIVAIAVDRYRVIVCSVTRSHYKKKTKYVIPMTWLVGFFMSLPQLLTNRVEDVMGVSRYLLYSICIEHWDSSELLMCYTVAVLLMQYLLPVLAIITLHVLICRFLRVRINTRQVSLREIHRAKRNMASHRKNMYLLTSIAVLFAVTWLPITLVNILADFDQGVFEDKDFRLIHATCLLVALCSVCINPVVYGWFNSNFRRDLQRWASTKISSSVDMVQYIEASTHRSKTDMLTMSTHNHRGYSIVHERRIE
ncbi:neuropeptide Y receptor type 5-like [Haliotis rubra]|uniref:neuropeptide Y receptor type 5-like n=1 Tax=Haliotis rubra TaxID=36100 RepID=UPI001EE5F0E1|nr:neuropeptide Y receptor type 5-like [Haliotis rubra]